MNVSRVYSICLGISSDTSGTTEAQLHRARKPLREAMEK